MLQSAAFEMLMLGRFQEASFRQADSMRKFDEDLKKTAPRLYKHLGYRMWYMA